MRISDWSSDVCSSDLGSALLEWPSHQVVKCLVFYHPDDPPALRRQQEERVLTLFDACRHTGHELMLEIIASKAGPMDASTTSRAVERFYEIGVFPEWWKREHRSEERRVGNEWVSTGGSRWCQ